MAEKPGKTTQAKATMPEFDMRKLFDGVKFPTMPDMEAILAAHKRNLEAFTAANRAALEGAQLVARRQMEIMQETMTGLAGTAKEPPNSQTPASHAARQIEILKKTYENAVANTQELGDLIQKSNAEAIAKLNARFTEVMNEMQTMLEKT